MRLASIPRILANDQGGRVSALVLALPLTVSVAGSVRAEGDDATKILKTMSDYMATQKSINVNYDTDIEVITADLQKIQFTSSGHVLMVRPDKLRVSRTGGYSDVELIFDGDPKSVV